MDSRDDTITMTQTRRFLRRLREPRLPFMPYGCLPALGLSLVFLFGFATCAKGTIEPAAERAAQTALSEAGIDWATPKASGQWITLEGTPPSHEEGLRALEVVRKQKARTFFGMARPVTRVRAHYGKAAAISPPEAAIEHEWLFRVADGVLRLEGSVPTQEIRKTLADTAQVKIDPRKIKAIDNQLTVTNQPAVPGFMTVALRGLETVTRCDDGVVSWVEDTYSLYCELPEASAAAVRTLAETDLPVGRMGSIEIIAHEAVNACNSSLADLLSGASIQFASGKASIEYESYPLLDRIADAIARCPGNLRIEGHTDSTGEAFKNLDLSLRRADAVRMELTQRGVPRERLETEGFGDTRPLADNSTPAGRARNRRIEIRVVRSPG